MNHQTFVQTEEVEWEELSQFPGIKMLPLAIPVDRGSIHRLQMKQGRVIPIHTHPCDEYVYVLSGEIETRNRICHAGTFWATPANTSQGEHRAITEVELLTIRLGAMGEFAGS